ncbi:MAG: hypothetical protein ACHQ1H_08425 [Nitrososphaerales archaeon]
MKNSQLLIIAAVAFGILGISLISFEVSTGFATIQIVQLASSAVVLIFLIGIFARSRKRISGKQTETSYGTTPSDNQTTSELLAETTRQRSANYWWIFVIGAFAELLPGVRVYGITEGKPDNWIFPMIFVIGACVMLGLAGWFRTGRQK